MAVSFQKKGRAIADPACVWLVYKLLLSVTLFSLLSYSWQQIKKGDTH